MPFKNKTARRHNIGMPIIYTCRYDALARELLHAAQVKTNECILIKVMRDEKSTLCNAFAVS